MKKIIKTTILLIMCLIIDNIYAQSGGNVILAPNPCDEYTQDMHLDKFVGVWSGSDNGKSLTIELKKEKINLSSLVPTFSENKCFDAIFGFHKFVDNNVDLENTLSFSNTTVYERKWTILGATEDSNTNNIIGTIQQTSINKSVQFIISYIDPTHIKIESLTNFPGIRINEPGKPPYDW